MKKREREREKERETGYERLHLTLVPFHPPYIHPFYGPTLLINHPPPSKINPLWERIILTKTPFLVVGWWCKPWAIPTAVVGLSIPPPPLLNGHRLRGTSLCVKEMGNHQVSSLEATCHPSVRPSVRPCVRPYVRTSTSFNGHTDYTYTYNHK